MLLHQRHYALVLRMDRRDKVLCVAATDPRMAHLRDIEDVSEFDRLEIRHFFEVYKALEPAKKWRRPTGWTRRPPIARSRRAGIALAALAAWAACRKQPVQLTGPDRTP
jgi:hypothetical protein